MKIECTAVVMCGAVSALAALGGIIAMSCSRPPVETPIPRSAAEKSYTLDVSRPECFLDAYLPGVFEDAAAGGLPVASIDGTAEIFITNGQPQTRASEAVAMEIILITSSISSPQRDSAKFDIHLIGSPVTLETAYTLARKISRVVGIADDRIVRWRKLEEYKAPVGYTCLQVGTSSDGRRHEIEIVHSLALDRDQSWAVDYQIYFSIPERKKLHEICSQ